MEIYDYMKEETENEAENTRYTDSKNGPHRAEIWETRRYNNADRELFRVMQDQKVTEAPKMVIVQKAEQAKPKTVVRAKKRIGRRIIKKLHRNEVFGMVAGVSAVGYALSLWNGLYTLGIVSAVCLWFAAAGILLGNEK